MQDYWQQLAPRERLLLMVGAAFILFALLWTMGLRPLYQNTAKLQQQVADKQGQLANFQELAGSFVAGSSRQSNNQARSNDSIVVIIDRTTRDSALAGYLKRNQPEGTGSVRIRLEAAPFDQIVEWLGELNGNYGMTIVTANFDDAGEGRVNCSLVLSRRGG
jgi:general secretion pathway protein M